MILNKKGRQLLKGVLLSLNNLNKSTSRYYSSSSRDSIEEQIKELKRKVEQNCILENVKKSEQEYNDSIDNAFKVYPIVLQLQTHEQYNIQQAYYSLLDFLATKKRSITFADDINQQLLNWIEETTLQTQRENYLKIERISTASKESAQQKQFHLLHRGHLQIFGVGINRSSNSFMHKYTFQKNSADLTFTRRITSQEKLENLDIKDVMPEELQGKTTKAKKQIQDIMSNEDDKTNASEGVRGTFLNIAKKFGYDFSDNKIDGSEYVNKLSEYKKKTFQSMRRKEEYILVEDFLMRTTESIRIKALSGETLWEDQPDANGLFQHYLRTEALCDLNEAYSVKNDRKRIISDIDGKLKGNPPCLIKRFDLSSHQSN